MATERTLNIITGRTGTAHVSSADDAAIYRGFVGNNNAVLSTDQQLSLDYSTAGTLDVSNGVFCINGRMGRISNNATVTYDLPGSGYFRRTILLVRYEYDSSDETESMTLMTLQSDPQSDTTEQTGGAASASVLPISVNQETDFVLYDFVCNADGVIASTLVDSKNRIDNIPSLRTSIDAEVSARSTAVSTLNTTIGGRVSTLESWKTSETNTRASADTALGNRISTLETWKNSENANKYCLVSVQGPMEAGYSRQIVICEKGDTAQYVMGNADNSFIRYTVSVNRAGTEATVSFVNASGGIATILGTVKAVLQ